MIDDPVFKKYPKFLFGKRCNINETTSSWPFTRGIIIMYLRTVRTIKPSRRKYSSSQTRSIKDNRSTRICRDRYDAQPYSIGTEIHFVYSHSIDNVRFPLVLWLYLECIYLVENPSERYKRIFLRQKMKYVGICSTNRKKKTV